MFGTTPLPNRASRMREALFLLGSKPGVPRLFQATPSVCLGYKPTEEIGHRRDKAKGENPAAGGMPSPPI